MRTLVAVTLIARALTYIASGQPGALKWSVTAIVFVTASCLLVGFLTPVVATVVGLSAAALAVSSVFDVNQTLLNVIVLTVAIALLGPGAFSLDARMFGRREILIPSTPRSSKS